ncbi:CopD family protein [Methylocapsa palsarum]|uniref:Putative copper resistance protein D n=1 Tax=Methylocapsa palsarum TaxID=1612308 RepID=A0A1I3WQW1_9HYPH|nr:CopD family protein [Methylocapsa palsarum]SFK08866.1 putative copper resistance protein D [Methylocapsa palsarum]
MTIFQILALAAQAAEATPTPPADMGSMPSQPDGIITIFHVLVLSRWIHFAAVFVLFGSSFFWFYMGRERLLAGPGGLPKTLRATTLLLRVAAPVAAISGVAWLAGILANMTSGFSNLADPENWRLFFFETQFGPVSVLRLTLLAAAVVVTLLPWRNRAWFSALLHIGALLLISQAWLGHANEGGEGLYGAAMIIAYAIHALAAGAWVGGLPPLLFACVEQRHFGPEDARIWTIDVLTRYSWMAIVAVALIVASGIANAGFRVAGSFDKLFDTGYGDVLFTKIGVVALMLALASFNRFIAMPRLRAATLCGMKQINKLRISVAAELLLGILVLLVAAVLGITPPPQ